MLKTHPCDTVMFEIYLLIQLGCDWLLALVLANIDLMHHNSSQYKCMQCLGVCLSCISRLRLVGFCLVVCRSPPYSSKGLMF